MRIRHVLVAALIPAVATPLSARFDASRSARYSLILVLLPALTAACDGGLGPSDPTWSYSLSDTTGVQLPLTATANGAAGELHTGGGYATPCLTTKDRISLQGSVDGSAVQLRIVRAEPDGGCQTQVDAFSSTAVLTDIPAGEYSVEVWYDNTVNRDGPVLDTVLAVSQ